MEFVLSSIVFFSLQLAMLGRITTFARHGLHTTPLAGRTLPTKPTLRLETGAKDLWRCLATSGCTICCERQASMHNSDYYREQAANIANLLKARKTPLLNKNFWN